MNARTRKSASRRVVWAIDPFNKTRGTRPALKTALQALSGSRIEPVYVVSPGTLNLGMDLRDPPIEKYLPVLEKRLAARVKHLGIAELEPARVVPCQYAAIKESVDALVAHALETRADLIVCETHARHGAQRLFLGSFTETLLLRSTVPVLVVNPSMKKAAPIRRILFPSDMSDPSRVAFREAVALARELGAALTLLHVISRPIEPVLQSGVYLMAGGWIPSSEYMSLQEGQKSKMGAAWIREAARAGVKARFVLASGSDGVKAAVLKQAETEGAGLIAMAAESGPVATRLLGSIVRQVVREATCPVWVLRSASASSKAKSKTKVAKKATEPSWLGPDLPLV